MASSTKYLHKYLIYHIPYSTPLRMSNEGHVKLRGCMSYIKLNPILLGIKWFFSTLYWVVVSQYLHIIVLLPYLCVFTFWVQCCGVRYDFRIKTMLGSSLHPCVCRRAGVFFTLFVFVCAKWCPTHILMCFCLVYLRLVYPMPVTLSGLSFFNYPFGIL